MLKLKTVMLSTGGVAALLLSSAPCSAQAVSVDAAGDTAQAEGGLAEIVVTAQKRSENLQNVPLAVTALTSEDLVASHLNSVESVLTATPNVQFSRQGGNARIAVRGLGYDNIIVGGEARVAYHADGVYMSRPTSALGTFFDVNRVEVLRGPQGTLYGRNSTAGAINVITNDPTDTLGGYGSLTVGNYDLLEAKGALSGPLGSTVSARLAFDAISRGGYGKNNVTGHDVDDEKSRAVRGKIKFEPSPDFRLILSADYLLEDDHAFGLHFLGNGGRTVAGVPVVTKALLNGAQPPANPRDIDIDFGPFARRELWGASANASWDVAGLNITSLTAYRSSRYDTLSDLTGLSGGTNRYIQHEKSRQISGELRVSKHLDWADFTLGGFYFNEHISGFIQVPQSGFALGLPQPDLLRMWIWLGGPLTTNAGAVFGQADVRLTSRLTVSMGARYSRERKTITESFQIDGSRFYTPTTPIIPSRTSSDSHTWSSFDPKITVQYRPVDGVMAYATYSKAFKSGGFNLGGFQAPFNPEKLTDYELGLKADLFDRRLRANISAFLYDYKDLQASVIIGTTVQILNAAKARVKGIEAEIEAVPVDNLHLQVSGALLDSEYRAFATADSSRPDLGVQNLDGKRLTQAPKYTLTLSADYSWSLGNGDLTLRGETSSIGKVYFSPFNREDLSAKGYTLFNASLRYKDESGWSAAVFGRNLSNELYRSAAAVSTVTLGYPINGAYGPPRTYGIELRYDF